MRDQVRRCGSEDGAHGAPIPMLLKGALDGPIDEVGVGDAAASRLRQGPTPAMRSVLYNPMMDSAQVCPRLAPGALSQESPIRPTEGSTPAGAKRSVHRTKMVCRRLFQNATTEL